MVRKKFLAKVRVRGTHRRHLARASSLPGSFRVRLGVRLGGEEKGAEDELENRGGRTCAENRQESVWFEAEMAFT